MTKPCAGNAAKQFLLDRGSFGGRFYKGRELSGTVRNLLRFAESGPTLLSSCADACASFGAHPSLLRLGPGLPIRGCLNRGRLHLGGVIGGPTLLLSRPDTPARRGAHGASGGTRRYRCLGLLPRGTPVL